jgi:hypothetical protein
VVDVQDRAALVRERDELIGDQRLAAAVGSGA